jgi:hypothetical protein
MAKITQTTDYYQIDGDAGGTGVIQINGSTATTTITGAATITSTLTVQTGGITVDAGGLTVTAGGATITAGDVVLTNDNLTVAAGNVEITAGQLTVGSFGPGIVTSDGAGLLSSTASTTGAILLGDATTGFTSLAAGSAGNLPVDSGSAFASVAASGDMTLAGTGAFTASSAIITGKTAETTIANDDLVLIYDTTAGALRQMTRANFVAGVSGSPGGSNTQIQYNNSGSFGGDSGFTTDGAGNLTVTGGSATMSGSTLTIDSALATTGFDVDADVANYQILTTLGSTATSELIIGDTLTQNFTLKVKNLTVDGTLTYIDTTNLRVEDALIDINSTSAGAGVGSNAGAGLNILSNTAPNTITFTAVSDGGPLRSSSGLSVATGTGYDVNGTSVLTATTLGSTVVNSSLTSVGTIATGTWEGTVIGAAYGGTGQDFSASSGAISVSSGTFSAGTLSVPNGGTGATSLTDGGVLLGSGTGAITATAQPTDGQLLIGSTGTDPVLATLTAGTNISITNAAGSITIDATSASNTVTGTYSAATPYNIDFTIPSGTRTNVAFRVSVYLEDSTTANSALVTIEGIVVRSSGAPLLPDFLFVVVPGTDGDKLSLGTGGANTLRIASAAPAGSGNYVATVTWTED